MMLINTCFLYLFIQISSIYSKTINNFTIELLIVTDNSVYNYFKLMNGNVSDFQITNDIQFYYKQMVNGVFFLFSNFIYFYFNRNFMFQMNLILSKQLANDPDLRIAVSLSDVLIFKASFNFET